MDEWCPVEYGNGDVDLLATQGVGDKDVDGCQGDPQHDDGNGEELYSGERQVEEEETHSGGQHSGGGQEVQPNEPRLGGVEDKAEVTVDMEEAGKQAFKEHVKKLRDVTVQNLTFTGN